LFNLPLFASSLRRSSVLAAGVLLALCSPVLLPAQTPVPLLPVIGSSNPVSAEPPVTRPGTTPCIVPLLTDQEFADFNNKTFSYTPPSGCKGPWSKVVLTADFNVTAGRQFDRTTQIYLGGTNIFFGTTAEPRSALSPSWHVERDITDLSALLTSPQAGTAILGNFVGTSGGVDYTGIIYGSAQLEFYPSSPRDRAAVTPDQVLPLSTTAGAVSLNTTTDRLTGTFASLPKNIESVYLDLFSQSQSNDEFWYTCSPTDIATELENCGNTGFRETEVYVDGQPAGIAPILPWVYTGGIDPELWEPVTGVQTLNFKPYRVDLTPFSALLSDGKQHTVSIGVYNADSYFAVTGTLLLYLDHHSTQVTGALTQNTLSAAPNPSVQEQVTTDSSSTTHGETLVTSLRSFQLSGYVNTSHGRVKTTINETVDFGNYQHINFNATLYEQDLEQLSGAYSVTKQQIGPIVQQTEKTTVYPFTFNYNVVQNADGSGSLADSINQQDYEYEKISLLGIQTFFGGYQEQVNTSDQYAFDTTGALTNQTVQSKANYQGSDTLGHCFSRSLTSNALKLTAFSDGAGCGGTNKP
jgi:hypothetical protein